ncbi:MarR family winged helix-turn-helix transcriptional regulator [uncultured Sphaerochaeta sp.]|uniref:MarR family winged helix-turn-helix transcriptional regulator n=1 Tax=uncultured Sphaerochaeta sp. TaxID=886478 RepID=UPI0029C9E08F|nr:MarR family winged helix-turn-helix transcriptional regulator [uncultured Sphaerochaeta sp.]
MKNKKSYGAANDLNLKALVTLSRCFQSVRRREMRTIKQVGLTAAQFGVLEILYHKGNLRIGEILEGTLSTGGNMTVVIENLEKTGFVVRYPDPQDGRASLIRITEKGFQLVENMFPGHVANIGGIFSVLSTEEKQQLVELLKKLGSSNG